MKMSNITQFMSVVDYELDIMSLFSDALSQFGDISVFGFLDSKLALEHFKLHELEYCLILSDYRMPSRWNCVTKKGKSNQSNS